MRITIILLALAITFNSCRFHKEGEAPQVSNCLIEASNDLKSILESDSVMVYSKIIREEIYFEPIIAASIIVYNPTTDVLDFKKLPTDHYKDFGSSIRVNEEIRIELKPIVEEMISTCDFSNYNDLIVELIKLNENNEVMYRFICHYRELLVD